MHTKLQASLNYADSGMHSARRLAMQWRGYYCLQARSMPRVLVSASKSAACKTPRAEAETALDSQEL